MKVLFMFVYILYYLTMNRTKHTYTIPDWL